MAVTTVAKLAQAGKHPSAPRVAAMVLVTLNSTGYTAGGELFNAQERLRVACGFDKAHGENEVFVSCNNDDGFRCEYLDNADPALRKLKLYAPGGAEAAGDLSVTPGTLKLKIEALA